ncbi:sirohydrochlorin ferrochelatase [Paenibacillus cellulosilyticus]|uniref:Sirohydrochlorin ferrochelatase n=1 Tax=Paenibacillus cellulosilyticus TaxID=375489 RepID=A0A2V2YMD1_9BACL|nr:CbiX/SirB N-terminal domain-containing protein [Paenibacillus cellulosilyticus]PWV95298.1 sirohydrochlorin ferrochelatase [Paenibacillus cellulosilyticus]QKS44084.1 cobalamin biosynthesis protein CbiX [Paenibacillus cellulosilyticus]
MVPGILVISHGSRLAEWVKLVDESAQEAADAVAQQLAADGSSLQSDGKQVLFEASYLELVEGRLIQDGVDRLAAAGVTDLFVLPLFISSGSTHVEDISQSFGFPRAVPSYEGDMEPFHVPEGIKVTMGVPIDDDEEIAQRLWSNLQELSDNPPKESLLLIAHGNDLSEFYERYEQGMRMLAERVRALGGLARARTAMLLPNEAADVLGEMLEEQPQEAVLVAPLFLSSGYFTKTVIPSRLTGHNYRYNGKALLPDSAVARWMVRQSLRWLHGLEV